MKRRARRFPKGGSQAVRLPRECRFEGQTEVLIHREGSRAILEPIDERLPEFLGCLGRWKERIERPRRVRIARARDPFR